MLLQLLGVGLILLSIAQIRKISKEYSLMKNNKENRMFMHKHYYGAIIWGSFSIYFGVMLLIKDKGVTNGFIELYHIFIG